MDFKSFWPLWIYEIERVFVYVSFNTQTVKIVVKTQIHMHWSVTNQKIKIFHDFRVFVLCPIPKNENSEIPVIHQNPQNTEMWICNFKNSLNAVQRTSISKWSSHIANNAAVVKTQIHTHWTVINQKIKIFRDFWVFVINPKPFIQKWKLRNHGNSSKTKNTEMWVCSFSKSFELLFKRHQSQND